MWQQHLLCASCGILCAISDRLCREHGLSVIVQGEPARSVSYIEWLRQSKGQPTFRSMLEADLRDAIRDANDLGHFFLLMEHKGYEMQGAAARYACCPESSAESEPSDSLTEADWRRFQRAVSHITISQDTEVTLIFTDKKATGKDE